MFAVLLIHFVLTFRKSSCRGLSVLHCFDLVAFFFKDRRVHVIYCVELKGILAEGDASSLVMTVSEDGTDLSRGDWPLHVELSNGQIVGCDLMIEATGVQPNSDLWSRDCHLVHFITLGFIKIK